MLCSYACTGLGATGERGYGTLPFSSSKDTRVLHLTFAHMDAPTVLEKVCIPFSHDGTLISSFRTKALD